MCVCVCCEIVDGERRSNQSTNLFSLAILLRLSLGEGGQESLGTFYINTDTLTSATKAHDDVIPCLLLKLLCRYMERERQAEPQRNDDDDG